ncbi:MAG: hypothetical protein QNL04_08170, partial [SAR324 cluster bacterium]|nr:hypothetical protein [SAR324 cluster bacterium]
MEQKALKEKSRLDFKLLLTSVFIGIISILILNAMFLGVLQTYYPEFQKSGTGKEVLESLTYQSIARGYLEKGKYSFTLNYTSDQAIAHWQMLLGRKVIKQGKLVKPGNQPLKISFYTHKKLPFRFKIRNKSGSLDVTKTRIV